MTETKVTEYADGLRALAHMIEANPHIVERLSFALHHMSAPNYTYDQLDALAEVGSSSADALGSVVTDETDAKWRHVTIQFGPVAIRGYGTARRDPAACPRCGSSEVTS